MNPLLVLIRICITFSQFEIRFYALWSVIHACVYFYFLFTLCIKRREMIFSEDIHIYIYIYIYIYILIYICVNIFFCAFACLLFFQSSFKRYLGEKTPYFFYYSETLIQHMSQFRFGLKIFCK